MTPIVSPFLHSMSSVCCVFFHITVLCVGFRGRLTPDAMRFALSTLVCAYASHRVMYVFLVCEPLLLVVNSCSHWSRSLWEPHHVFLVLRKCKQTSTDTQSCQLFLCDSTEPSVLCLMWAFPFARILYWRFLCRCNPNPSVCVTTVCVCACVSLFVNLLLPPASRIRASCCLFGVGLFLVFSWGRVPCVVASSSSWRLIAVLLVHAVMPILWSGCLVLAHSHTHTPFA